MVTNFCIVESSKFAPSLKLIEIFPLSRSTSIAATSCFFEKTFSKALGLAGIRLGVGYSNQEIISYLKKIKPPYNINSLTEKKAIESLEREYVNIDQVNETINERKFLELKLKELAFVQVVFPSNSNFLPDNVASIDRAAENANAGCSI